VLPGDEPELPDFESMLKPSHFAQQDTGSASAGAGEGGDGTKMCSKNRRIIWIKDEEMYWSYKFYGYKKWIYYI